MYVPTLVHPVGGEVEDDSFESGLSDDVVYIELIHVLQANPQLKISLLGNRMDECSRGLFTIMTTAATVS